MPTTNFFPRNKIFFLGTWCIYIYMIYMYHFVNGWSFCRAYFQARYLLIFLPKSNWNKLDEKNLIAKWNYGTEFAKRSCWKILISHQFWLNEIFSFVIFWDRIFSHYCQCKKFLSYITMWQLSYTSRANILFLQKRVSRKAYSKNQHIAPK